MTDYSAPITEDAGAQQGERLMQATLALMTLPAEMFAHPSPLLSPEAEYNNRVSRIIDSLVSDPLFDSDPRLVLHTALILLKSLTFGPGPGPGPGTGYDHPVPTSSTP